MTNNQLRTFEAPALGNLKFTVWDRGGAPWFIAKEAADLLGIKAPALSEFVGKLGSDEHQKMNLNKFGTTEPIRGNPMRQFISESGLYKLIIRSKKEEAAQFQDWVTKVVLPAIRKDGAYVEGEEKLASGEMSEDEFVFKAMEIMQGKIENACVPSMEIVSFEKVILENDIERRTFKLTRPFGAS